MTPRARVIRSASERDGAACAAIYAPYVTDTAVTFEIDPPGADEMAGRIAPAARTHAWLVLEDEGRVVGYAYGSPFKARAAYRWASEVSIYLEPGRRRTGAGRALYEALFSRLAEREAVLEGRIEECARVVLAHFGDPLGRRHLVGLASASRMCLSRALAFSRSALARSRSRKLAPVRITVSRLLKS